MQMGYEEIAVFDQYLSSSRVINGATVRCYMKCAAGPGKLVTLIAGICVYSTRVRPVLAYYYYGHLLPRDTMRYSDT